MSAIATCYLIKKDKFREFCAMANLVPHEKARQRTGVRRVRLVTKEEMNSPEQLRIAEHYSKLWKYLWDNSTSPFSFDWSGYVMLELLTFLKDEKKIDLMENTIAEEDGAQWSWHILDTETKKKYSQALDPGAFSAETFAQDYAKYQKKLQAAVLDDLRKKLSKDDFETFKKRLGANPADDFPERGEAMLDGVKILHDSLQLIDDKSVIMVHIG